LRGFFAIAEILVKLQTAIRFTKRFCLTMNVYMH